MTTPTTLTARTPEDVLAVVPVVLGFVPTDSVVMLTFGAARAFHARVDLPHSRDDVPEVVSSLLDPARRHRVRQVLLIVYSDDDLASRALARTLVQEFRPAGIDVLDVLRADGRRWFALLAARPGVPDDGVPYDVSAHPFRAQAVVDGLVTHGSREQLAATLAPDPGRVAALAAALGLLPRRAANGEAESAWVRSLVERHVCAGTEPTDQDAARAVRAMLDIGVRDAAWSLMSRADAREHVAFWTGIVRRCPLPVLAAPATLLAFAAWLSGHGALAWCALDRCSESDPDYRLADHLAQTLIHAIPPTTWEESHIVNDSA